ncbi:MAG: dCMP deaminase family protein [Ignavibacteria bacterium]|jgi:dCMP deaminase
MTNIQNKQERYDIYFMHKAKLAAAMSFAKRLQTGAILTKDNRSLMDGWNGTVANSSNNCEESCKFCLGTGKLTENRECHNCGGTGLATNDLVLHAEQNLLMSCAKYGIPTAGATLYVTHSPCKTCAKLIAQAGISEVVYSTDYRDTEGLDFLHSLNTKIRKVN